MQTSLAAVVGAEEFEAAEEQILPAEGVELPHHAAHHAVADSRGVSTQPADVHAWGLCGLGGCVEIGLGACGCQAAIVVTTSWTSTAGELRWHEDSVCMRTLSMRWVCGA